MKKLLLGPLFLLCTQLLFSQTVYKVKHMSIGQRASTDAKFKYGDFEEVDDMRIIFDTNKFFVTNKGNSEYTIYGKGEEIKIKGSEGFTSNALDEKNRPCVVTLIFYDDGRKAFNAKYDTISIMYNIVFLSHTDN